MLQLDEIEGSRIALLDLDGVICDDRHRVEHALSRNWGMYFALMVNDRPWRQGLDLYDACIYAGWDIVYLTGRREDTRDWTLMWLLEHGYDVEAPLLMRPQESREPLALLKAGIVEQLLRRGVGREVRMYDDDPEVIEHVGRVPGAVAVHCTWHIKPKKLVKKAYA